VNSRTEQGLPEKVTDEQTLRDVARLFAPYLEVDDEERPPVSVE
jgi:hypothetical protein